VEGRLFAIGGNDGRSLSTVESYDVCSGVWRADMPMPSKRCYLVAVAI